MANICENGEEHTRTKTNILQQLHEYIVKFILKRGTYLLKNKLTAHCNTTHMLKSTN
jgi:hypothetical protein